MYLDQGMILSSRSIIVDNGGDLRLYQAYQALLASISQSSLTRGTNNADLVLRYCFDAIAARLLVTVKQNYGPVSPQWAALPHRTACFMNQGLTSKQAGGICSSRA